MKPELDLQGPKKTRWWEHALRFVFGGAVTAAVGLIAHQWGPVVGGLFLGFPFIFPAGITLVNRHDGRETAIDDARGACLGSLGLIAFGLAVWASAQSWAPAVVLVAAAMTWLVVRSRRVGIRLWPGPDSAPSLNGFPGRDYRALNILCKRCLLYARCLRYGHRLLSPWLPRHSPLARRPTARLGSAVSEARDHEFARVA